MKALCMTLCFIMCGCAMYTMPMNKETKQQSSLVEAELSFARSARASGMRAAFLQFLDDEAIVYRPQPVRGKPVYEAMKPSPILLAWYPILSRCAASGELGFTTGPWELSKSVEEPQPVQFGHYISIWKRSTVKPWRVMIDGGIVHGKPPENAPCLVPDLIEEIPLRDQNDPSRPAHASKTDLRLQEQGFRRIAEQTGNSAAYRRTASDSIRLYRNGSLPLIGKGAAVAHRDSFRWLTDDHSPVSDMVSDADDLGATWGIARAETTSEAGEKTVVEISYLRIWERVPGKEWRIIIDLALPLPIE